MKSAGILAALAAELANTPWAIQIRAAAERKRRRIMERAAFGRNLGAGAYRAQRSPELVAELKAAAEAKRQRKAAKLRRDWANQSVNYYFHWSESP